jgi:hypothetical protein
MADAGFPGTYSTTTTTATTVTTNIRFDPSYIRTIPGMLKIVAVVNIIFIISNISLSHVMFCLRVYSFNNIFFPLFVVVLVVGYIGLHLHHGV